MLEENEHIANDAEARELLAMLTNKTERMRLMIRDLLEYSKLEGKKAFETVSLNDALDKAIDILKDDIHRVFGFMERLHHRDDIEGSGIGLSTCKRIVENHGGEIGITSVPGKGSTFYFKIPV